MTERKVFLLEEEKEIKTFLNENKEAMETGAIELYITYVLAETGEEIINQFTWNEAWVLVNTRTAGAF